MKKKKMGFTLVELLAVIVILAVILVIAVPKVTEVINNSRKATFESSAKTIAEAAEKRKMENDLLENTDTISCSDVVSLNDTDYASCSITFDGDTAKVSMIGSGKFKKLLITDGTKDNAVAIEKKEPEYGNAAIYIANLYDYDATSNGLKIDNTDDANLRYYGSNPNNYVSFNDEIWRIIGVFGDNVKIIRAKSLGNLSWDSSNSTINEGWGVNEWSQSDLNNYLNTMFYGGTSTICYSGNNDVTTPCPTTTLTQLAKSMIDYHNWNTAGVEDLKRTNTVAFYNTERSTQTGKNCGSGSGCNDTVERTTEWKGYVALPYATDWAYASAIVGCGTNMQQQDSGVYTCKNNNWMHDSNSIMWLLSPRPTGGYARHAWNIGINGTLDAWASANAYAVFPTVYLKSNVKIIDGKGNSGTPYILDIEN